MSKQHLNRAPFFANSGAAEKGELHQDTSEMNVIFVHSRLDDYGLPAPSFRVYCHLARRAGRGSAWPAARISPSLVACTRTPFAKHCVCWWRTACYRLKSAKEIRHVTASRPHPRGNRRRTLRRTLPKPIPLYPFRMGGLRNKSRGSPPKRIQPKVFPLKEIKRRK